MTGDIPVLGKFKSVTEEGKLLDYDEIADVPIIRRDLNNNFPTETGYYQHTGSKGSGFLPEVIYYFFKANETDTRLSYASLDPQDYANVQMLEDGRYDLSAYGFVDDNALENYVPKTSTGDIYITSNADLRLDASGGNGTTRINMDGVDSYIGITASDIRLIGDDNIGITFTQRDINISGENVYLSGNVYANNAKVSTESYVQSYASAFEQTLTEARVDLSNYFKELDTFYGDNSDVSAGTDGIHWSNNVAFIGDHGEYQGKYWGNAPIVAGDNVTFTVDSTNQVVKISANLSNHATKTYVDNAVSALVDSSPETLNTLNELAAALGDDPNFATTVSTEIGKKQNTITGAATTITSSNLTASRALISDASGKVAVSAVTSTELGYLDGVTSAIQTQLNGTVKLAGAQTITGDKTTTGLFKIQNGAASGSFVLGADVNAKTLTANVRKLGRMGVPSYDSTTKTMAGISFDSQQYANYADFGGHPNNTSSIAPDVIRFVVANKHDNTIAGVRKLALQISNQAGLSDTSGGGTSVAGAKFFVPVIVDGNLSATSLTENGTALSDKYLGKTAKASSATVADSANAVAWSKVSGKPTFATVATSGSYNDLSNKPTIPTTLPASDVYAWAKAANKPSYSYSEITGKPTLATVATSGSYNDLSNKPTIPAAVSVTQKLTSGTEIGSVTVGSTTTKLYAPTATSVDLSGYLPLSGGTITGNILFSNSNAQGAQPNLKWKTINSKTPYVGYCTASTDGTFLVASLGGTSYTTGLSIGGSSGNLLWKGTRVATTSDIPSLSNYSTLANTIKALSISGKTITYTKGDGTTGTLTTQDTVYSLPTAGKDTLGGVKTTSTVTSASGYTACPIIGGVPYYKDTDGQLRQYYTHANMDVELPVIYSYNTTVSGTGDYKTTYGGVKAGFTFNPYTDTLSVGNINFTGGGFFLGPVTVYKDENSVDFMLSGGDAGIYMYSDGNGDPSVDLYGNVTVNGEPIGSGGGGGNAIRTDWSSYISSVQDLCFLIPDYDTNENDFVGEVELWIENIDADWGDLNLFEGITADYQLNSDNTIAIPDDCITMYIKFSFVDNYIIVQGNDTHGMSYTCGFARPIEKPSGRLFSIAIAPTGSGRFAIIGRTVEYL